MEIYIKENNIFKNRAEIEGVDFEIIDLDLQKKNIFIGKNGVGKSFLLQTFAYLAYLNLSPRNNPFYGKPSYNYDRQKIIQNLVDLRIGDVSKSPLMQNPLLLQHNTSYYGQDDQEEMMEDPLDVEGLDPDVRETLRLGARIQKALDRTYYVKIGRNAKEFFDKFNIIYYSNSPYTSNETFFSGTASSFQKNDIDVAFWVLYRNLPKREHFKIKFWLNNSLIPANAGELKKLFCGDSWRDKIEYKYRNIFNYYDNGFFERLKINTFFDWIIGWIEKNKSNSSPSLEFEFNSFDVDSYLIVLMLKEYLSNFNYSISYKNIPLTKLNSGRRYKLTLECLESVCDNGRETILIVDEPENSLDLSAQEKIAETKLHAIIATHSPVYAMSMMQRYPDKFKLHLLTEEYEEGYPDRKILVEKTVEDDYLRTSSIDAVAAEFFSYCPFLDAWNKINPQVNDENLIDINQFYRDLNDLK